MNKDSFISTMGVGNASMDEHTEALAESILNGCVPASWMSKSYPSLKSLGNYMNDLKSRIEFWQVENCIYFWRTRRQNAQREL